MDAVQFELGQRILESLNEFQCRLAGEADLDRGRSWTDGADFERVASGWTLMEMAFPFLAGIFRENPSSLSIAANVRNSSCE